MKSWGFLTFYGYFAQSPRYLIAVQKYCQLKKGSGKIDFISETDKNQHFKKGLHKNKHVIFKCFDQKIRRARRECI
jgi:hypothetical protein